MLCACNLRLGASLPLWLSLFYTICVSVSFFSSTFFFFLLRGACVSILLFLAMAWHAPAVLLLVVRKPRNLKGFKSQGMVVCAVQALGEGKVGVRICFLSRKYTLVDLQHIT